MARRLNKGQVEDGLQKDPHRPRRTTLVIIILSVAIVNILSLTMERRFVVGFSQQNVSNANDDHHSENKTLYHNDTKPTLVLHVGPLKTGSTTIQTLVLNNKKIAKALSMDNVTVGDAYFNFVYMGKLIDQCLQVPHECDHSIVNEYFKSINADYQPDPHLTVIKSCETYSVLPNNKLTKELLRTLQDKWNVKVLVVYRRLTSWLPSRYTQARKGHMFRSRAGTFKPYPRPNRKTGMTFPMFYDQMTDREKRDSLVTKEYYDEVFGPEHVRVLDMHAQEGLAVEFVCKGLNASRACETIKGWENKVANSNDIFKLDHDLLVLEAHRQGLIQGKSFVSRHEATQAVQRQLELGNMTMADLPQTCLSQEHQDIMWERSLLMENLLTRNPLPEKELRQDFESKLGRFCSVNASAVLQNATLRDKLFVPCAFTTNDSQIQSGCR
jgi:hypothetical protein